MDTDFRVGCGGFFEKVMGCTVPGRKFRFWGYEVEGLVTRVIYETNKNHECCAVLQHVVAADDDGASLLRNQFS